MVHSQAPGGGEVEFLSGLDLSLSARVYSWPAGKRETMLNAQAKLVSTFTSKVMVDTAFQKRKEIHLTLWGWTDPKVDQPDMFYAARVTRVGDLLVAALVATPRPDSKTNTPIQTASKFLENLEWVSPPRRKWGQVYRPR